jgi:hypothetical protein
MEGIFMEIKQKIEKANEETAQRLIQGDPVLVDIAPAGEVIPGMEDRMILHSGPPIEWSRMCGAQRGAILGNVLFEEWASTVDEAQTLLEEGKIHLEPNHHHQAVGPMAGTISVSAPVWVVENKTYGNRAYCRQVEGRQQFGEYSQDALQGLRMWRDIWAPTLREALTKIGGLELKPIMIQALQMGDELHNRHSASSSLFANKMAFAIAKTDLTKGVVLPTLGYITNHHLIFLGLAMAAGKAISDPAHGVEYSTVVTAMARNGTEFGIRVSGLGDEWFTAPAPFVDGLYLPGYSEDDAGFDMGEKKITVATHPTYLMPALGFMGTSIGIDIRKVVQTNIAPIIDTAIAHKDPGYPIIGAGLVRPPMECFKQALIAFGRKYHAN